MKKILKKIVILFIMFMGGSYAASFTPAFITTVIKGFALGVFILPPIYFHFNDEDKYRYCLTRSDLS